jgi:uncharacterized protein (TIGR03435 family)
LVIGKNGSKFYEAKPDEVSSVQPGQAGHLVFRKQGLGSLVNNIANMMDTPVEDMTGLTGVYDYELDLTPDPARLSSPAGNSANGFPTRPDPRDIVSDAVERLGLRLEDRKASVEVLVIDHIERPTEN